MGNENQQPTSPTSADCPRPKQLSSSIHQIHRHAQDNMLSRLDALSYYCPTLRLTIAFAFITLTTQLSFQQNANDTSAASTVVRLADMQQCPFLPKPHCEDPNCQRPRWSDATQFFCSNKDPIVDANGLSVTWWVVNAAQSPRRCCVMRHGVKLLRIHEHAPR